jgi:hypothetical protein
MSRRTYTDDDRAVALSFVDACGGDVKKAARRANVPENVLRYWLKGGGIDPLELALETGGDSGRPYPPPGLRDIDRPYDTFAPAPEVAKWAMATFVLDGAPLQNPDHAHLALANIEVMWTTVANIRQMRQVAGQMRTPFSQGDKWVKALYEFNLRQMFGDVPDFIMTLDAVIASQMSNTQFCALVEHELYHAAQKVDRFGSPRFSEDGEPQFAIRGHDIEQFKGVRRRYGATTDDEREYEAIAKLPPLLTTEKIDFACGTCLAGVGR